MRFVGAFTFEPGCPPSLPPTSVSIFESEKNHVLNASFHTESHDSNKNKQTAQTLRIRQMKIREELAQQDAATTRGGCEIHPAHTPAHRRNVPDVDDSEAVPAAGFQFAHRRPSARFAGSRRAVGVEYGERLQRKEAHCVACSSTAVRKRIVWLAAALLSVLAPRLVLGACGVGDGKAPTIRGVHAVLGIEGTVTDPAGNLQGTPVPGPHAITGVWDGPRKRQHIKVVVGSRIELNISAAWGYDDNVEHGVWYGNEVYGNYNLSLYAYEDPGVPNGAVLTTQACLGYPQQVWDRNTLPPPLVNPDNIRICNPVRRTFSWEPRKGQEGLTHSMCFVVLVNERPNECQSAYRCIDIEVLAPGSN